MMWAESRSMLAKGIIGGIFISGVIGFLGNSSGFRISNFLWYGFIVAICICFMTLLAVRVPTKIAANISPLEGTKFTFYNAKNFCIHRYHCKKTNSCGKIILCGVKCVSFPTCNQTCKDFVKERCSRLDKAPYVCNGCYKENQPLYDCT